LIERPGKFAVQTDFLGLLTAVRFDHLSETRDDRRMRKRDLKGHHVQDKHGNYDER